MASRLISHAIIQLVFRQINDHDALCMLQFQSHSLNASHKAVARRANAGQMLEASGLTHLIKAVHRQHDSKGDGRRSAGSGADVSGSNASGSSSGGRDQSSNTDAVHAGGKGNPTRAAAVKAAMVHAWRG